MSRDQTSSSSLPCRFSEFRTTHRSLPRKQHSSRASVWRQCWWIYRTRKQWCALSPRISHGASASLCLCCALTFFFSPSFFLISLSAWKVEAGESEPKGKVLKNFPPAPHGHVSAHCFCWMGHCSGGGGILWAIMGCGRFTVHGDVAHALLSCKR